MTELPPPQVGPDRRDPGQVPPASAYTRDDQVWVWRHDTNSWHPGAVLDGTELAVMVTYQPTSGRGEVVDSFMPERLAPRSKRQPGGRPETGGARFPMEPGR